MCRLVERAAGRRAGDFSVADFVAKLFAIQRRYGLESTTAFTMAIVALLVLEGMAKEIDADLDFQAEARPYLFRASLRPAGQWSDPRRRARAVA